MGQTPSPSLTPQAAQAQPQLYNPQFGQSAKAYMPSSYFSNQPITDPSAILNAYLAHLPQFQQDLQSSTDMNSLKKPDLTPQGGGGGSGGSSIMSKLDPISSIFGGLF